MLHTLVSCVASLGPGGMPLEAPDRSQPVVVCDVGCRGSFLLMLLQKRKSLLKADPRAKHYLWSSLLLGLGVTFSIVGPLNTYLRSAFLITLHASTQCSFAPLPDSSCLSAARGSAQSLLADPSLSSRNLCVSMSSIEHQSNAAAPADRRL